MTNPLVAYPGNTSVQGGVGSLTEGSPCRTLNFTNGNIQLSPCLQSLMSHFELKEVKACSMSYR